MRHNCNEIVVNFKVYHCAFQITRDKSVTKYVCPHKHRFEVERKTDLSQCVMNTERDSNL